MNWKMGVMGKRMRKTKIVCTIGPASESPQILGGPDPRWDERGTTQFFSRHS